MKNIIFYSLLFLVVAGHVEAATHMVKIYDDGTHRYIESNGIPNHSTGRFPNKGNPHTISAQAYKFRVPLHPQFATKVTMLTLGKFGVAVNGVPFDPGANEFYNNDRNTGLQYEALSKHVHLGMDKNNAHVQPNGAYHYHGIPKGLLTKLPKKQNILVGYAADGFPIYVNKGSPKLYPSYFLGAGERPHEPGGKYDGRFLLDYVYVPGRGDLDECNGRIMISPEYPEGIYSYFITKKFPFIPRCFKGVVDVSFQQRDPVVGHGPQDTRKGHRPPRDRRRPSSFHRHP